MKNDDCVRYNHYTPPYEYTPRFRYGAARKAEPCPAANTPGEGEREKRERMQPNTCACKRPECRGLLRYRNWWELAEVDIAVNGERITGMPIFVKDYTLRVVNNDYSYFIPMEKIDYIRTSDGLRTSFTDNEM